MPIALISLIEQFPGAIDASRLRVIKAKSPGGQFDPEDEGPVVDRLQDPARSNPRYRPRRADLLDRLASLRIGHAFIDDVDAGGIPAPILVRTFTR